MMVYGEHNIITCDMNVPTVVKEVVYIIYIYYVMP